MRAQSVCLVGKRNSGRTQHLPVTNHAPLRRSLDAQRRRGIRIAVDDAGSGFASFRHIVQLAPEIIKLDRELIGGIDTDPARRTLAAAVVMFAAEMGAPVIAEGIETLLGQALRVRPGGTISVRQCGSRS